MAIKAIVVPMIIFDAILSYYDYNWRQGTVLMIDCLLIAHYLIQIRMAATRYLPAAPNSQVANYAPAQNQLIQPVLAQNAPY
jgi:ABC-type transport system involved in cytochrome bd biosynthesis fused ATPase/permease subunit